MVSHDLFYFLFLKCFLTRNNLSPSQGLKQLHRTAFHSVVAFHFLEMKKATKIDIVKPIPEDTHTEKLGPVYACTQPHKL